MWRRDYLIAGPAEFEGRAVNVYMDLAPGYYEAHSTLTSKKAHVVYFEVDDSDEVELLIAAPGSMCRGIEAEVADLQHRRPLHLPAPGQSADPCEQLLEGERLGEVVVGSRVEADDAIVHGVACRQHQHRRPDLLPAQAAADLEAVRPRQHHVEDDRVVRDGARHPQRLLTAIGDVRRVPLLA